MLTVVNSCEFLGPIILRIESVLNKRIILVCRDDGGDWDG